MTTNRVTNRELLETIAKQNEQLARLTEQVTELKTGGSRKASAKKAKGPKYKSDAEYLDSKKQVALRYSAKKGQHYHLFRRPDGSIWVRGEHAVDRVRNKGQNPEELYGTYIWSTYEAIGSATR